MRGDGREAKHDLCFLIPRITVDFQYLYLSIMIFERYDLENISEIEHDLTEIGTDLFHIS